MKKKLGDFTLAEIKRICAEKEVCMYCPFRRKESLGGYLFTFQCLLDKMMEYPYEMDVDKEVEIEEEEK